MIINRKLCAALALGTAISLSPVPVLPAGTVAKVEAAKITHKTAAMAVGGKLMIAVVGTKKKVKWSSSNKKVAKVSKNGVITAKKAGKATIKAKVSKKTYKCKVTVTGGVDEQQPAVENPFNIEEASKLLTYQGYKVGTSDKADVVGIFKNNYDKAAEISVDCLFYDENGILVGKTSNEDYCFEAGKECVLGFSAPYNSDYETIPYSSYEFSVKVAESIYAGVSDNIAVTSNFGDGNVMATITNNSGDQISTCKLVMLFYKGGNLIGYDEKYAEMGYNGATDYLQFDYPHDENYETIVPDDYVLYINHAYKYLS